MEGLVDACGKKVSSMTPKKIGVSIIIPVYNSEDWIKRTLEGLSRSLKKSHFDAEIIVVDDGSSDKSASEVEAFKKTYDGALILVRQKNKGRYIARSVGVDRSTKESILFLDSRIDVHEGALEFLSKELEGNTDQVWNGHVYVEKKGNIFARFWDAIAVIGWRRYFKRPRKTSYVIDDFDYYPKGTGFFFVPRRRLLDAMRHFEKGSSDLKYSSDDTLLIRYLAQQQPINLSPDFSCTYHGRSTFSGFLKHAYNRGQFFVDGFLRRGTRFFYPLIAVLLFSLAAITGLIVAPTMTAVVLAVIAVAFITVIFIAGLLLRIGLRDAASLALLSIPFALVYLAGIWRGVGRKLRPGKGFMGRLILGKKVFLAGSLLEYLIVFVLYTAITIAVMGFIPVFGIDTTIFTKGPGDATSGFVWLNYVDRGLSLSLAETMMANYPLGEDPSSPIYITYLLLWAPIRALSFLFGSIASINLVTMFGFISTAMAAYWLVKRLTGSVIPAFFAGYSLAFFPYAIAKGTAHLAYVYNGLFVVLLAAFVAVWRRPVFKRALLLAFVLAACFYFDGYFILLASVMLGSIVLAGVIALLLFKKDFRVTGIAPRFKAMLISLVAFLILVAPIAAVALSQSEGVSDSLLKSRSDIAIEIPFYRSWPVDFLIPASDNDLLSSIEGYDELQESRQGRSDRLSNTSFLGYSNMILAALGVCIFAIYTFRGTRRRDGALGELVAENKEVFTLLTVTTVVASSVFVSFMLSPSVTVLGATIPLPGALFIEFDIALWRNLSRFSGPLQVVLVIYAAYVLWMIMTALARKYRRGVVASSILGILAIAVLVPTYINQVNTPSYDLKKQPGVYSYIASRADVQVVTVLPVVDQLDELSSTYFTTQMIHGKKLVNSKDPRNRIVANNLGSLENPETLDWAYLRGATHVLARQDICSDDTPIFSLKYDNSSEGWCLYALKSRDAVDDNFVIYNSGVDPTPNFDIGNKNTVRLNSNVVDMSVVRSDLSTRSTDRVDISANIHNWNREMPIVGTWRMIQKGVVIGSGNIGAVDSFITARGNGTGDIELVIERENGGNDLLIQEMKVTRL